MTNQTDDITSTQTASHRVCSEESSATGEYSLATITFWLAFGTFVIGCSEFAAMGLLPYFAEDFGITEKVKTRVAVPKDILKLAFQGNGGSNLGYDFNFNFGLDVLHTREFAIGYNRTLLDDKLSIGGRLKYIRGLNVINKISPEF